MELFLLDTLKITFGMEESSQGWTQLGPFFPRSGHFFSIFKQEQGRSPPPHLFARLGRSIIKFAFAFILVERSCKSLEANFVGNNKPLINGIYKVKPSASVELNVYCDMTNFNGGWTLIVASDTNSWTKDNLLERNSNKPSLNEDYSILKYANLFKENYLIGDSNLEYRLEANHAGKISLSKHYLFKFNNRNTRKSREICAKLMVKTSKRHHWRRSDIIIVNFEYYFIPLEILEILEKGVEYAKLTVKLSERHFIVNFEHISYLSISLSLSFSVSLYIYYIHIHTYIHIHIHTPHTPTHTHRHTQTHTDT